MRSRGDTDWITLWWSEAFQTTTSVQPNNPIRALLTYSDGLEVNSGDMTIVRIVGQSFFSRSGTTDVTPNTILHERIRGPVALNAAALPAMMESSGQNTPGDADSAELPSIMWHRCHYFLNSSFDLEHRSNMLGGYSHPGWSMIDIRVKRRLHHAEGLIWELGPMGPSTSASNPFEITWGLWLRGLVEFKG